MTTTQQTPNLPTETEEKPYTFTELGDDKYRLQYGTGEVAEGTWKEVIDINAGMTAATKLHVRELRAELDKIKEEREADHQRLLQAVQPTPPPPSPQEVEQSQMDDYIFGAFSRKLGRSPEEVVNRLQNMEEQAAEYKKRALAASFFQACPDFPQTEEAANKIEAWRVANDIPEEKLTLANLKSAHASCIQYGQYKPLTQEEINAQYQRMGQPQASTVAARAQAPPILPTGQPEMTGNKNMWEMTPDEIRKMYFDKKARGES